jgi:hypothetical protein
MESIQQEWRFLNRGIFMGYILRVCVFEWFKSSHKLSPLPDMDGHLVADHSNVGPSGFKALSNSGFTF